MPRFFILAFFAVWISCTSSSASSDQATEGSGAPAAEGVEAQPEGVEAQPEGVEAQPEAVPAAEDPRVELVRQEVALNLARISDGARSYFATRHANMFGEQLPHQFPLTIGPTPALEVQAEACQADGGEMTIDPAERLWSFTNAGRTWAALRFEIRDPHRAVYGFESEGVGDASTFSAYGQADPACTGQVMRWQVTGNVEAGAVVIGEIEQVAP